MSTLLPSQRQSPHMLDVFSHSAAQTIRLGQRLGELLQRGDVLLLNGEFGAGKTHLSKGIAQGLGSDDAVNSPSFVFINEYRAGAAQGRFPIYHVDLYRIDTPGDVVGIGLDEALSGDGVCIIEWADRAAEWLPAEHLAVQLGHLSETKRTLRFEPRGQRYTQLVDRFKRTAFA